MRKSRAFLLSLPAAGLLAVLGIALLGSREGPGGQAAGPVPGEEFAAERAVVDWPEESGDLGAPARSPSEAPQLPETGTAGPAGPGPTILVVDEATGQGVPDVAVQFLARNAARALSVDSRAQGVDAADLPIRFGATRKTDALGRAVLPAVADTLLVSARDGDRFGNVAVSSGQREATLVLQDDQTLRIRVTAASRAPVPDAPVVVFRGKGFGEADEVWNGTTGADGIATLPHFQLRRDRTEAKGPSWAAALQWPMAEPVATGFDGEAPPADPVELRMPATAGLQVQLVHRDGEPAFCAARLRLQAVRADGFSLPLPVEGSFDYLHARKPEGSEPFRFPAVGLGMEFVPLLRVAGDRRWRQCETLRGPLQAGTTARVQVTIPAELTVLAGRVLDVEGAELAGADLRYELTSEGAGRHAGRIRTAGGGRLELALLLGSDAGPYRLDLRQQPGEGPTAQGLQRPLGSVVPGRRNELGDLQLGALEAVVTGRVVDDRGEPVAGAGVRLQRYEKRGRRERWVDTALGRSRSDAEGGFAVPGPPPAGRLRVAARAREHVAAHSEEVLPGARVTLQLVRTGTLAGSVLLPDWLPRRAVSLRLVAQQDLRQRHEESLRRRRGEATPFELDDLPPGLYDAVFTLRNFPEPLERVAAVAVQPGANADPRLQGLDLRQHIHRYRLQAVDAAGRPLAALDGPVLVRHEKRDGRIENLGFRWQKGRAELWTASPAVEVTVFGVGYQPRTETLGPGDHAVYMRRLQPARIHLPGARQACGIGRKVRVSMVFTGDTGLPQSLSGTDQRTGRSFSFPRWELSKSNGAWLGETDTVDVPLSRNGPHEVILRLYQEGVGGNVSVPVGVADVVVDGPQPVEHTLAIDPQRIAAVVAQLEARARQSRQRPGGR